MAGQPLSADEAALWARVMDGVRPLRAVSRPASVPSKASSPVRPERSRGTGPLQHPAPATTAAKGRPSTAAKPAPRPGTTLDAGWDKRLARGRVEPDRTVDLHGHTLHSAHDLLDRALDRAIAGGERVILLVTGKPPGPESERPHRRGAIRASVGDWLALSRHARHIAAVRGAGPGHGGQGALYIVLRRGR